MTVKTKFSCDAVSNVPAGADVAYGKSIILHPVIGESPENDNFYKQTPGGNIMLSIVNMEAAKLFEVGKEYFVEFSATI
jgi:hypothetical protein